MCPTLVVFRSDTRIHTKVGTFPTLSLLTFVKCPSSHQWDKAKMRFLICRHTLWRCEQHKVNTIFWKDAYKKLFILLADTQKSSKSYVSSNSSCRMPRYIFVMATLLWLKSSLRRTRAIFAFSPALSNTFRPKVLRRL